MIKIYIYKAIVSYTIQISDFHGGRTDAKQVYTRQIQIMAYSDYI